MLILLLVPATYALPKKKVPVKRPLEETYIVDQTSTSTETATVYARATVNPVWNEPYLQYHGSTPIVTSQNTIWFGTGEQLWQNHGGFSYDVVLQDWTKLLDRMEKWNFNTIRLKFNPYDFDNHVALIDQVITKIGNYGMKVILDYHNFRNDDGHFGSQEWIDRWRQIARRYRYNDKVVAYELWNEPFSKHLWHSSIKNYPDIFKAYQKCTEEVRKIDNSKIIVWGDPLLSNVLPREDGFQGWFGDVITQYANNDVTFALHRYPPIEIESGKSWTGINWLFKAMDYLKAKGFGVWLGEFGPMNNVASGGDFTTAENKAFTIQCINGCIERDVGFSLWEYRLDHFEYQGFYDDCLKESVYSIIN